MSESQYVDVLQMDVSEAGGNITLASPNFFEPENPLPAPGRYFSPTRSIKGAPHKDYQTQAIDPDNFDFQIRFGKDGLVVSPQDPKPVIGAPIDYIDTTLRKSWRGVGEGSKVVRYLLACGFPEGEVLSLSPASLRDLMAESQNRPVGVRVGWTNDKKFEEDKTGKRVYTTAFRTGIVDGKAVFAPRVTLEDGRIVTAKAIVEEYFNIEKFGK